MGETKSGDIKYSLTTGEVKTDNFTITIYEGSVIQHENELKRGMGDERYKGLTLEEAIGATAVHESGHTESLNLKQAFEKEYKGVNHDIEENPKKLENAYIKEINDKK